MAIGVSLALLIRELSQPRFSVLGRLGGGHDFVSVAVHPDAVTLPGMLILRPEEPLFFGNVEAVLDSAAAQLAAAPATRTLVLSLEESPDLDGTAMEALGRVRRAGAARRLRAAAGAPQGSGARGARHGGAAGTDRRGTQRRERRCGRRGAAGRARGPTPADLR